MANHGKTPDAPKVQWGSIVANGDGYSLATMTTQNGKPVDQHLGEPTTKAEAEDQFRIWAAENLMGWEVE